MRYLLHPGRFLARLGAFILVRAAQCALSRGEYPRAERLFGLALRLAERVLGPTDVVVGAVLNDLGIVHKYQGRFDEAERLYRRALAIKEKRLGGSHPEVATTLNNLAVLCRSQARHAEAQRLYHRAMVIFHGALGPSHPSTQACGENYEALAGRAQ